MEGRRGEGIRLRAETGGGGGVGVGHGPSIIHRVLSAALL